MLNFSRSPANYRIFPRLLRPRWEGRVRTWVSFRWVYAAGLLELRPLYIVYFMANYRLHLSHFWVNVTLATPTYSLSVYA